LFLRKYRNLKHFAFYFSTYQNFLVQLPISLTHLKIVCCNFDDLNLNLSGLINLEEFNVESTQSNTWTIIEPTHEFNINPAHLSLF
jgi:hypothetical protein